MPADGASAADWCVFKDPLHISTEFVKVGEGRSDRADGLVGAEPGTRAKGIEAAELHLGDAPAGSDDCGQRAARWS